jgi:hypothetical protein
MEVTVGIRVEVEEEEMVVEVEVEVEETVSNVGSQVTGPENALVVVAAAVVVAGILLGMVILEGKELHTKPISACVFSSLFILDWQVPLEEAVFRIHSEALQSSVLDVCLNIRHFRKNQCCHGNHYAVLYGCMLCLALDIQIVHM